MKNYTACIEIASLKRRVFDIRHGKVTKTQLNITNESQEVSPFPAGDHKAAMNRCKSMTKTKHK